MTVSVTILDTPIRIRLTGDAALAVRAANEMAVAVVAVTPATGAPGEPGTPGALGPPGPAGEVLAFEYVQSVPSTVWLINHNLGRLVNAAVFSPGGVDVLADVVTVSPNQVQVLFAAPATGTARLI